MTTKSVKPSRPLTPLEELAKKQKMPTVLELLEKSLETQGITYLANDLHFQYTNLHAVLAGKRRLPPNPSIYLARLHGYTDEQGMWLYLQQELDSDTGVEIPPKPRGVPEKKPRTSSLVTPRKRPAGK